ncbi:unnamed protein product [Ectocarpus sp. 12 AP-2014]
MLFGFSEDKYTHLSVSTEAYVRTCTYVRVRPVRVRTYVYGLKDFQDLHARLYAEHECMAGLEGGSLMARSLRSALGMLCFRARRAGRVALSRQGIDKGQEQGLKADPEVSEHCWEKLRVCMCVFLQPFVRIPYCKDIAYRVRTWKMDFSFLRCYSFALGHVTKYVSGGGSLTYPSF